MEPCNYVSNVAYYHDTTRICDYPDWSISDDYIKAQKRQFATLALGSSFWHGSRTFAGSEFDDQMIAIISYLAYQSSIDHIANNSTILRELTKVPRNHTAL